MLSNETKIDWQFINNEELLNKLVIAVNQIASKYWNDKGLDNYSNAGLFQKEDKINPKPRKRSLLDCQDAVQEYILSLIEKITNDRDNSFIFGFVKKGIQDLIIDEIRRRNPLGYVKPKDQKISPNRSISP